MKIEAFAFASYIYNIKKNREMQNEKDTVKCLLWFKVTIF